MLVELEGQESCEMLYKFHPFYFLNDDILRLRISLRLKNQPWQAQVYSADVAEVAAGSSVVCDQGVPWQIMINRLPPTFGKVVQTIMTLVRKSCETPCVGCWDLPYSTEDEFMHSPKMIGFFVYFFVDSCLFQQFTPSPDPDLVLLPGHGVWAGTRLGGV